MACPLAACRANEKLMLERLVIKKGAFLDVGNKGEVRPACGAGCSGGWLVGWRAHRSRCQRSQRRRPRARMLGTQAQHVLRLMQQ